MPSRVTFESFNSAPLMRCCRERSPNFAQRSCFYEKLISDEKSFIFMYEHMMNHCLGKPAICIQYHKGNQGQPCQLSHQIQLDFLKKTIYEFTCTPTNHIDDLTNGSIMFLFSKSLTFLLLLHVHQSLHCPKCLQTAKTSKP